MLSLKKKNRSGCWRLLLIETCPRKSLPSVVLNTYCFLYVFLSYYSFSLLIFMCLVFFLQLLFKVLVAGFCWDSLNHPSSLISVSCNFNSRFSFLPLLMASFRLVLVFSVLFITVISLLGLSRAAFLCLLAEFSKNEIIASFVMVKIWVAPWIACRVKTFVATVWAFFPLYSCCFRSGCHRFTDFGLSVAASFCLYITSLRVGSNTVSVAGTCGIGCISVSPCDISTSCDGLFGSSLSSVGWMGSDLFGSWPFILVVILLPFAAFPMGTFSS